LKHKVVFNKFNKDETKIVALYWLYDIGDYDSDRRIPATSELVKT
jgi:hypothetical protein